MGSACIINAGSGGSIEAVTGDDAAGGLGSVASAGAWCYGVCACERDAGVPLGRGQHGAEHARVGVEHDAHPRIRALADANPEVRAGRLAEALPIRRGGGADGVVVRAVPNRYDAERAVRAEGAPDVREWCQ
jgi:hypothetical protein